MRKKSDKLNSIVLRMERKADKNKDVVLRYEFWGLMILVAIPLPGTGAWTGALVAAMMDMQLKRAFPAIALGVVAAAFIVTWVTYGASIFL
jgi:predicted membrane protein